MFARRASVSWTFRAAVLVLMLSLAGCAEPGDAALMPVQPSRAPDPPIDAAIRGALAEQLLTANDALRLPNAGLADHIDMIALLAVGKDVFFLAELDQEGQTSRYFGRAARYPDFWTVRELAPPDAWSEVPAPLSNEVALQRLGTVPASAIAGWVDPTIDRLDIVSGTSVQFAHEPQDGAILGPLTGWGLLRAFRRGVPLVAAPTGPIPGRSTDPVDEIARAHADAFADRVVLGPEDVVDEFVADRMHPEFWMEAFEAVVRANPWQVQPNPLPTSVGWIYELAGPAGRARLFVTLSHEPEGWRVFGVRYVFLPET